MSDFKVDKSVFPLQLARLGDSRNVEECRSVFKRLLELMKLDQAEIGTALNIFDDVYALYCVFSGSSQV